LEVSNAPSGALSFRVKSNEYFVPLTGTIDVEAEIAKIEAELNYTRGFLASVQKKLANERFVAGAPEQVVALERKKAADAEATIETLEKSLANLK
jgi:valyl-tRNA synthetase